MEIMPRKGKKGSEENAALLRKCTEEKVAGAEEEDKEGAVNCSILSETVREKIEKTYAMPLEKVIEAENEVKKVLDEYRRIDEEAAKEGIIIAR